MAKRLRALTEQAERFVMLYVAGTEETRGNGTQAYLRAYPNTTNKKVAGASASRLLTRESVRVRMKAVRDEAEAEATARLRSWMSLAPKAQAVLDTAMEGDWPKGWSDEQIRTALKAAQEALDRALGSTKHMHSEGAGGQTINVFVAATASTDQQAVSVALPYAEQGKL